METESSRSAKTYNLNEIIDDFKLTKKNKNNSDIMTDTIISEDTKEEPNVNKKVNPLRRETRSLTQETVKVHAKKCMKRSQ